MKIFKSVLEAEMYVKEIQCIHTLYTPCTHMHSTALKSTRAAKLESIDGGPKNQAPVIFYKKGKDFEFKDLSLSVSFVECSARGKGEEDSCTGEIETVQAWLKKLA